MSKILELLNILDLHYSDGRRLSRIDEVLFRSFCRQFIPRHGKRMIYRGSNCLNVQMGNEFNAPLALLSDHLFIFGDKGYYFIRDRVKSDVLDTSWKIFSSIWTHLNGMLLNKRGTSIRRYSFIEKFKMNNPNFSSYFLEKENRKTFLEKCSSCDSSDREIIKDYYYGLIHTFGGKPDTYFVSSTTSYQVAKQFAGESGIIEFAWLPLKKSHLQGDILYQGSDVSKKQIQGLGLPVFDLPIYVGQKEVSLKCGILPHFILGFQKDNKFIVNPALIRSLKTDFHIDSLIQNGLEIDQSRFNDFFNSSQYRRTFVCLDGQYYIL